MVSATRTEGARHRHDAAPAELLGGEGGSRQRYSDLRERVGHLHCTAQGERMAKLEGSLDGFLAGRRDRDVA